MKDWPFELNLMAAIKLEKVKELEVRRRGNDAGEVSDSLIETKTKDFVKEEKRLIFYCFLGNFLNSQVHPLFKIFGSSIHSTGALVSEETKGDKGK